MSWPRIRTAAAIAVGAAALAGAAAYLRARRSPLSVTLYSEPHYRGIHKKFHYDGTAYPLSATGLPKVGSIKIEERQYTFRRAQAFSSLAADALNPKISREDRAEAAAWLGVAALRMTDPSAWRGVHDPAGDRQSWVRLWARRPTSPTPAYDPELDPESQPWRIFGTNTPDTGVWASRVQYLEIGERNPHRSAPTSQLPADWEHLQTGAPKIVE